MEDEFRLERAKRAPYIIHARREEVWGVSRVLPGSARRVFGRRAVRTETFDINEK